MAEAYETHVSTMVTEGFKRQARVKAAQADVSLTEAVRIALSDWIARPLSERMGSVDTVGAGGVTIVVKCNEDFKRDAREAAEQATLTVSEAIRIALNDWMSRPVEERRESVKVA